MSLFRFIASKDTIPEINLSGFVKLKVKDIKKMNPLPRSPVPIEKLDDDAEVLFAASESDIGGLSVSTCNNPPYGLDDYINKPYVYWLGGNINEKWITQLREYLQSNIKQGNRVELWSIWFGNGYEDDDRIHNEINMSEINSFDFGLLNQPCCCISILA